MIVSKKVSPKFEPERSPIICLNPIMASIGLNCLVSKETVMPINAKLFDVILRSVVKATLIPFRIVKTFSLVSKKVDISLSITAALSIGSYNGCRQEIKSRNAGSSPMESDSLPDTMNSRKSLSAFSRSNFKNKKIHVKYLLRYLWYRIKIAYFERRSRFFRVSRTAWGWSILNFVVMHVHQMPRDDTCAISKKCLFTIHTLVPIRLTFNLNQGSVFPNP